MRNDSSPSVGGDKAPKLNIKMRIKNITSVVSALLLLTSFSAVKASTVLTAWDFDQLPEAANSSPSPTTGYGSANALALANPEVVNLAGSSNGGTNAWQVSGGGVWSTAAAIGSQGVQFNGSTFGYYRVMVSFDVYATPDAEANLQVQYTTEGTIWFNATNITVGGSATLVDNTAGTMNGTNGTAQTLYVALANGWNNQITVDLSGISGVDNNPNFAIRIVNASTGTNCVDTTGAVYNNTSGSWAFNNVSIQGASIDTIADWTFASYSSLPKNTVVENPIPEINIGISNSASCIGFNTSYDFAGTIGSTNAPDVTSTGGDSTPSNPYMWRLRGAPGNGWYSDSPIGTQGAEFDVNTVNFSNILVSLDVYFTSQAEARMCVLYTTNGWTNSMTANSLFYGANPTYILTNDPASELYDNQIVSGTYFYETAGQNTYNNFVVDFTGLPNVANNPYFGIRFVNAATGSDDVAYNGGSYNDNSGNCRLGNVNFGGHFNGSTPPALTSAPSATVDNPFTNTFTDDPVWRANIYAVYVNGALIPNSAYNTSVAGQLVFSPANSPVFQVNGSDYISIYATNYSVAKVTQLVAAGAFRKLSVTTQPQGPSASGGTLLINPALALTDQYGNTTTNPYANVTVTAANTNSASHWTLGGATTQAEANGVIDFTNLSATLSTATPVNGAVISLTINNFTNSATHGTTTNINLNSFNIGAGPVPFTPGNLAVLQVDTVTNATSDNVTFSIVEIKPSVANQAAPVNIVPVSATTSNALREATSGTTGRLALSDDGTLLCFDAFMDGNAFTPDETLNLNRAAVGMNCSNQVTIGATYVSTSLGGSQARAAVTLDDQNYFVVDKGGFYYGQGFMSEPNVNGNNNVVVKSFGYTPYAETQKVPQGNYLPVIYTIGQPYGTQPGDNPQIPNNLGTDPNATDFYLVSTNGGQTYDILYTCDQATSPSGASIGVINKFAYVAQNTWVTNGAWTNSTSIDGMFVATNGNGGAYIYYTTGSGGTAGNSVFRVTDTNGWNQPINIISSNLLYTTTANASLKGLTFVPQYLPYTNELIPPPIEVPQTTAQTNSSFTITNLPDDPQWRSDITAIYVNGTLLNPTNYSTTTTGVLKFFGADFLSLEKEGTNTFMISATGYSTNFASQVLVGAASQLIVSKQPVAPKADGGALATQPTVTVEDAASDVLLVSSNITATASQGTWTLAGNSAIVSKNGVTTYTNLAAFSSSAITGAKITFTTGPLSVQSSSFNIPAPIYSVMRGANSASGNFAFTFTNITGLSYSVLATNNIAVPLPWPVIGTATESPAGSGIYKFTNSVGTNTQFYYLLKQAP